MEERRSEKVSVMLTPAVQRKLDAYAARHHWKRSAAASILIEDGLSGEGTDKMTEHEHRYSGQTLRHSHPDGDKPHGYYGHPEDYPQVPPATGELYNGEPLPAN